MVLARPGGRCKGVGAIGRFHDNDLYEHHHDNDNNHHDNDNNYYDHYDDDHDHNYDVAGRNKGRATSPLTLRGNALVDASAFAAKLTGNFMGTWLYFNPRLLKWQFVRRVFVATRRNPMVGRVHDGHGDTMVKDHLWPVHTCTGPDGGYRTPNERDLHQLYAGDMHRHGAKALIQQLEDDEARAEAQRGRETQEWEAAMEKETVGRLRTAHNVPTVTAGITVGSNGQVT